jgi:hypothetical protein
VSVYLSFLFVPSYSTFSFCNACGNLILIVLNITLTAMSMSGAGSGCLLGLLIGILAFCNMKPGWCVGKLDDTINSIQLTLLISSLPGPRRALLWGVFICVERHVCWYSRVLAQADAGGGNGSVFTLLSQVQLDEMCTCNNLNSTLLN